MKKFDFLRSTNFILLRQVNGNSITNCDFFKVHNLRQWWPLWLLAPGVKNLAKPLSLTLRDMWKFIGTTGDVKINSETKVCNKSQYETRQYINWRNFTDAELCVTESRQLEITKHVIFKDKLLTTDDLKSNSWPFTRSSKSRVHRMYSMNRLMMLSNVASVVTLVTCLCVLKYHTIYLKNKNV